MTEIDDMPFYTVITQDGSVESFVEHDEAEARKIWEGTESATCFALPRIIIGSERSKAVFGSVEIVRIDFMDDSLMIEVPVKLPAESQSFMQFMLSNATVHMRLRGGEIGIVNLAKLAAYIVYPGRVQISIDAWLAKPIVNPSL